MRANSNTLRLGYTSSWKDVSVPGRGSRIRSYIERVAKNRLNKRFINFGDFSVIELPNGSYDVVFKVYVSRYDALGSEEATGDRLPTFGSYLNGLLYVLQNDIKKYIRTSLSFRFVFVRNRYFSAELLSSYILKKLSLRFKLPEVINSVHRDIFKNKKKLGIMMHCSGRFDRKERASHHIFRQGKISLNTIKNQVDYHRGEIIAKYGVCGIKVWVLNNDI